MLPTTSPFSFYQNIQLCGNLYILRCVRYHFGAVVDWDVGYFHHYSPILPRVPASSRSGAGLNTGHWLCMEIRAIACCDYCDYCDYCD